MKIKCNYCNKIHDKYYECSNKIIHNENKNRRNRNKYRKNKSEYLKTYDKFYSSSTWQDIRRQALLRDKGLCRVCLSKDILTLADEVHHIEKLRDNWDKRTDIGNLISVCKQCHIKIESKDASEVKQYIEMQEPL